MTDTDGMAVQGLVGSVHVMLFRSYTCTWLSQSSKMPAMQSFNNTRHDYEITLEPSSVVELCNDEEAGIANIQYHVRPQYLNPGDLLPAVRCHALNSWWLRCPASRLVCYLSARLQRPYLLLTLERRHHWEPAC